MVLNVVEGQKSKWVDAKGAEPGDSIEFILQFDTPRQRDIQSPRGVFTSYSFGVNVKSINGKSLATDALAYFSITEKTRTNLFGKSLLEILKAAKVGTRVMLTYRVKKVKSGTFFGLWEIGGELSQSVASPSVSVEGVPQEPAAEELNVENIVAELVKRSKADNKLATTDEVRTFVTALNVDDDVVLKEVVTKYMQAMMG